MTVRIDRGTRSSMIHTPADEVQAPATPSIGTYSPEIDKQTGDAFVWRRSHITRIYAIVGPTFGELFQTDFSGFP